MRIASHRIVPLNFDSLRPLHLFRATGHRTVPGILSLASILFLTACGGGGSGGSGSPISISPQPASVPVNGTVTFTAVNAATYEDVLWSIYCDGNAIVPGGAGALSTNGGTSITYTAPATPPIYAGPCMDGEVVLQATVPTTPLSSTTVSFTITAPTVTVGLGPPTATVKLGSTEQFVGYAVGSVNNALTWQVNGVTGGSAATGTITNTVTANYEGGLYTAPTVMPMTGSTITITLISQADPTKTQTAIVTLQ
jgi:hypothetical protein